MDKIKIAILDDEEEILKSISRILLKEGFEVFAYSEPDLFFKNLNKNFKIVFLDVNLNSSTNGIEILKKIRSQNSDTDVIMISGNSDIKTAVDAIKLGAKDFIEKPIHLKNILESIENIISKLTIKNERNQLLSDMLGHYQIIGNSKIMKSVKEQIQSYSNINESILITGESGTGKELVAANIHYLSKRRGNKYYKINIASLSENLIESELFGHKKGSFSGAYNDKTGFFILSDNSTLFLDEIGELKLDLQSKLLRAIQEKEVTPIGESESIKFNAGFIFATNKDLLEESKNKRFREDLYYRISTLKINLPPLRERIEDIEEISEKLIENFCIEYNLSIKNLTLNALKKLKNYYYPGNIRELKNIITRGVILSEKSDKIDENHIIFDNINLTNNNSIFEESNLLSQKKKELEKIYVETQLKKFDYDLEKTASVLGLLINNLYRKMKELEIRE